MPLVELRDALQRLKDFRPIEEAEEGFVYLCAGFCDALAHFPAYASLRRLAVAYEIGRRTHAQSPNARRRQLRNPSTSLATITP